MKYRKKVARRNRFYSNNCGNTKSWQAMFNKGVLREVATAKEELESITNLSNVCSPYNAWLP